VNTQWTEAELAYFAGILDGEGCLSMSAPTRRTGQYATQIFVGNTDARLIHWIHARFGGTVALRPRQASAKPTHKQLWRWLLSGSDIVPVLSAVSPYLVIKREQAQLILEMRQTMKPVGSNQTQPLSNAVLTRREELKARLAVLNRRGVPA
jgi:hypothetical protein